MLFRVAIGFCCKNHMKQRNTLRGQNALLFNINVCKKVKLVKLSL
jgi:hypothetical protein